MLLIMPIACLLTVSDLTSRNPFSLGMGSKNFDSAKPGIVGLTKHQAILGLAMWSVVHIFINGDVASFCMFGLLTLQGFGGPKSLDAKCKKNLGEEAWTRPFEKVSEPSAMAALRQMGPWRSMPGCCFCTNPLSASRRCRLSKPYKDLSRRLSV